MLYCQFYISRDFFQDLKYTENKGKTFILLLTLIVVNRMKTHKGKKTIVMSFTKLKKGI